MDQLQGYLDAILKVELDDILQILDQTINNPLANLQASLLILAGVVILTLLAIVGVITLLGFTDDDEDDEEEGAHGESSPADTGVATVVAASVAEERAIKPPRPVLTPEQRRYQWALNVLVGAVAVGLLWGAFSVTTASEVMCLSCHEEDMPHSERLADKPADPHSKVNCIQCHESGSALGYLTYDVTARVGHFVLGMTTPKRAGGYGAPTASGACLACHAKVADETIVVEDRGIRVSHAEPLEAGATCVDCHEVQSITGAVGAWTVGMSACLRCHDNEQASAKCESCHTKDIAYAVHTNAKPEPQRLIQGKRCYTCHEQAKCDSCHGTTMPHSAFFMNTGHAYEATLDNWYNDGRTCKKCHPGHNMCLERCHNKGPFPGHPIDGWPQQHGTRPEAGFDSCDSCHGSMATLAGRNFCGVCHEQYKGFK